MIRFITASGGVYEVDWGGRLIRKVQSSEASRVDEFPWHKFWSVGFRTEDEAERGVPFRDAGDLPSAAVIRPGHQLYFDHPDNTVRTSIIQTATRHR